MIVSLPPAIASIARLKGLSLKPVLNLESPQRSPICLVDQLEGSWTSFEALPLWRKLALSQVASVILGRRRSVKLEHMLGMDALVPEAEAMADEAASKHAYVATVTLGMIQRMKNSYGVVASSEFAWLRAHDLAFWRLINGFGRQNHIAECVGAFAQFELECRLKKPLQMVDFSFLTKQNSSLVVN